jgi:16S rRNA (cytidine1402-2'-O)-methyltransferase
MAGILYIVATPIGNLEDMTFRAVRVLKEVDLIAAEDTRHSRKLLNHFGINTPLTSYYDHNQLLKGPQLIEQLLQGKNIALISDAGTPCISDPGFRLVQDAVAANIKVVPIPGACAAITALSASGLPSDSFFFAGFPPARQARRRSFLADLAALPGTLILYEAPHRLSETLSDLAVILGDRQVVVARELTKFYEELLSGTAGQLADAVRDGKERGEVVILIASPEKDQPELDQASLDEQLGELMDKGHSVKDAAILLAASSGLPRRELYARALQLKNNKRSME